MDWSEFPQWLVTAILGAAIVKMLDAIFDREQQRRKRKEEKINKLMGFLASYAELDQLYTFKARTNRYIKRDEKGDFLKDEQGEYIVEEELFEPESRFQKGVKELFGADIDSVIAQKIVGIRVASGSALDLAREIDPTGKLNEKFQELHWHTVNMVEASLKSGNFQDLIEALRQAQETRRQIHSSLQRQLH